MCGSRLLRNLEWQVTPGINNEWQCLQICQRRDRGILTLCRIPIRNASCIYLCARLSSVGNIALANSRRYSILSRAIFFIERWFFLLRRFITVHTEFSRRRYEPQILYNYSLVWSNSNKDRKSVVFKRYCIIRW